MNANRIAFDIYALALPKNREDGAALAREALAELIIANQHIKNALARALQPVTA